MSSYSGETDGNQVDPSELEKFKMYNLQANDGKIYKIFVLRLENGIMKAREMRSNKIISDINIYDYYFYRA
jgi:hypothetical protein